MSRASLPTDRLLERGLSIAVPGSISRPVNEAPDWVMLIPGVRTLVTRLGVVECRRRLLHMLPGLLPCLLWGIPHQDPWGPLLMNITVLIAFGLIAFSLVRAHVFARPNEEHWPRAVLGYGIPVLGTLFLLPGRSELGLMTLGIMSLGDGSAALVGLAWGGRRLPWNPRKSWIGLASFIVAATSMSALFYWFEARPGVSFGVALLISGVSAFVAAIVESLPIRSHDNLRVGTAAALTGLFMHVMLLGW